MLELADVHTYYGESHVLQGVSLGVRAGEVVAILGRNGAGKTTLIRSVIGFTPPRRGTVHFKGVEVTRWPPYRAVERGMGLVPQGRRVFPSLSVVENLAVARRDGGRFTLARVLELFDLLLMDEPTEGLAPLIVREVGRIIGELKREGLSILLVEQNLPLALSVADTVHVLSRGQIVHSSAPGALMANDDVKSRYLGV